MNIVTLYLIACSIFNETDGKLMLMKAQTAESNYRDALYAVSVEGDGTDSDIVKIMAYYGFEVDGMETDEPTLTEKIEALNRIPKFRNH